MTYTARNTEVEAIELAVVDAGDSNGDHYFFVRGTGGDALIEKGAFLSMYAPLEADVPRETPKEARKPAKKSAEAKPSPAKIVDTPSAQSAAPKRTGGLTINEAICQVLDKHEALTTKELAVEVGKIRPGSEPASIYQAVSVCIGRDLIKRRDSDNKLMVIA